MSSFRLTVRRAVALAAIALSALVSGCATYSGYDDAYYSPGDSYRGDYYYDRYDRYDRAPYWGAYAYDSILWPTYRWYDPWYSPGYYYGINYSPSWFGLSFGYYGRGYGHYYPWAYHHYSPYRYSWWDNHAYYGGTTWRHGYRDRYSGYRFGSARNEAERIARAEGARPQDERTQSWSPDTRSYPGASGPRSRGIDYGDRREQRAARSYDPEQSYPRDRGVAPGARSPDWRGVPREGPREIDARAYGGGRPAWDRGVRELPPGADAHARSRAISPYDERPTRYEQPRYEQPRYPQPGYGHAAPRGAAFEGSRPSAPSRSYDPPSMPSPRTESAPSPRSETGRSREPD